MSKFYGTVVGAEPPQQRGEDLMTSGWLPKVGRVGNYPAEIR